MATMTMSESQSQSPHGEPVIPNFREDERIQARYDSMLQRRIKSFYMEHESSIRRNASQKRDDMRRELDEAQAEWQKRSEVAEAAREAYRQAYPHHVKNTRFVEPTVGENLKSLGAAKKLYTAAQEAWLAEHDAASVIRKIEHNESTLDVELKRALERAPFESKEVTESAKWLAEVHAEEEMAAVKAKVEEVRAEREAYAKRLAAGKVPPEELRLRSFGEQDIRSLRPPATGLMFYRIDQFGPKTYFILRDLQKKLYALPYDRRVESLMDGVYDIVTQGKDLTLRRTVQESTRLPLALQEHFLKCCDGDEEASQNAYRLYQQQMRQNRFLSTMTELDETEAALIQLLVEFAAAKTR